MASLDLENLTDFQIRQKIIDIEGQCGPVTSATRKSYIKKLKKLLEDSDPSIILKSPDKYDPKNIAPPTVQETDNHQATPSPSRKRQRTSLKGAVSSTTPQNHNEVQSSFTRKRSRLQNKRTGNDELMETEISNDLAENVPPSSSQLETTSFLSSSTTETDENQDFGNMIAKKLRKYDDLTKNIIQNEIMSVFIRADSGYYN